LKGRKSGKIRRGIRQAGRIEKGRNCSSWKGTSQRRLKSSLKELTGGPKKRLGKGRKVVKEREEKCRGKIGNKKKRLRGKLRWFGKKKESRET